MKSGRISEITDHICIGDEESYKQAHKHGITAILNVATDLDYPVPDGIDYQQVPMTDDENNDPDQIQEAVTRLRGFLDQGKRVLVHCHSGVSRSPSVVALYFNQYEHWPLLAAMERIQELRPIASPGDGFWQSVLRCAFLNETNQMKLGYGRRF